MLPISLREEQIARQMSSRIYSRALELYRKGAVENLVLRGRRLNAQVQGFHEPFYTVTIDFDEQGVRQATCTCAYDYGDWCKHIGAVLLACIRAPEKIVQMPPIEEVLEPLDAAALQRVLLELASEDHAPEATRTACLEEANKIILNARSRDYPLAADWLEVVKRSYHAEGKPHEWEAFIQTMMEQHKRKTALIPLLRKLAEEG